MAPPPARDVAEGRPSEAMQRALELARSVLATTSPNPAVGAVLVRGGEVVGEGATRPPGGAHAEVVAIERAGAAARGATLYVTLEPCCTQGRTPPCTDAILAAGIERVVVAMPDADPRVDGRAIAQLREAGLAVELGDGLTAARRHYEAYAHHRRTGRPFVTAKFAASLDGKIAATSGDSRWISSPETRAWSHVLRTQIDAILVGVSTVIVDDPELTARPSGATDGAHQPLRVVLDSRGRISAAARVLRQQELARTVVLTTSEASDQWLRQIQGTGATVERVAAEEGHVALEPALRLLAERYSVVTLLVEGGGTVHGALFDRGLVDKVAAVIAPMIIGGDGASAVRGRGARRMAQALRLRDLSVEQLGPDLLVSGYPRRPRSLEEVALRPAGLADLERCTVLVSGAAMPVAVQAAVQGAFDRLQRDAGNVWLALQGEAVVGAVGLAYESAEASLSATRTALLEPLLIADEWQESELAERLVEATEASASGHGFDWLVTAVPRGESTPRAAWAVRGYRYYRRGTDGRTLLIKDLRPVGAASARAPD